MIKHIAVIYNPKSGSSAITAHELHEVFKQQTGTLELIDITTGLDNISKVIIRKRSQLIVAAGGDGTVNACANLAVKHNLPMGVIPVGTLNHFAKDIGLQLNTKNAAQSIMNGSAKKIDYCSVNGHVFVNNASIGTYPATVLKRDKLQPKFGKWPAATLAFLQEVRQLKATRLRFELNGKRLQFKTPLVFIGNNSYQLHKIGFTNRVNVTNGNLFLYVVKANRVGALMRLVIGLFIGRNDRRHGFSAMTQQSLKVISHKPMLEVAVDGEVISLQPPLEFVMHNKALELYM